MPRITSKTSANIKLAALCNNHITTDQSTPLKATNSVTECLRKFTRKTAQTVILTAFDVTNRTLLTWDQWTKHCTFVSPHPETE